MAKSVNLLQEQIEYYRERALEYDEWFFHQGRDDRGEAHLLHVYCLSFWLANDLFFSFRSASRQDCHFTRQCHCCLTRLPCHPIASHLASKQKY
jgi:hypothetical protein